MLQAGSGERIRAAAGEIGVRTAGGMSNSEWWFPTGCLCSSVEVGSGWRAGAAFAALCAGLGRGQRANARRYLLARLRRCFFSRTGETGVFVRPDSWILVAANST